MQPKSKIVQLTAVLLFLLSIASSPTSTKAINDSQKEPKYSTPQLIKMGLKKGEIDSDTAYLYFAYALQDDMKIPAKYRGEAPYEGTLLIRELKNSLGKNNMKASVANQVSNTIDSFCDTTPFVEPPDPLTNFINTSHFYIEYGVINGGLSINDYTATLETAWDMEVNTFGWAAPPVFSTNPPPNNLYHVRIMDLPPFLYGLVTNIGTHAGFVGDNPNTAWDDGDATATCMVLNNNYLDTTSLSPQAALTSTIAHEFNHSIQFGYTSLDGSNIQGVVPNDGFVEGGATWMEDEVFDESNDNYRVLWPEFGQDSMSGPGDVYAYWITFRGLTEVYGTGIVNGAEQVMQDFWENISKGSTNDISAFNSALTNKGTNLSDAFHAYAIAVKFNKPCNQDYVYPYCFEEANEYVAIAGDTTSYDTIDTVGESFETTLAGTYGLKWIDLPIGSQYDVSLRNTHTSGELRMSVVCDTGQGFIILTLPEILRGGEQSSLLSVDTIECINAVAVITNQDISTNLNTTFLLITYPHNSPTATATFTPIPVTSTPTGNEGSWIQLGTWDVGCNTIIDFPSVTASQFKFQMVSGGGWDNHISFYGYGSSGAAWLVNGAWQEVNYPTAALDVNEWRETNVFEPAVVSQQRFSVGCNDGEHMSADVYYRVTYGPIPTFTPTPVSSPTFTPVPTTCTKSCFWEQCSSASQSASAKVASLAQGYTFAIGNFDRIADQAALLYRVRDEILNTTEEGQRYTDLYYTHSAEIASIMNSHSEIAEQGLDVIDALTPNLQAMLDGQGSSVTITNGQVQQAQVFLDVILPYASPQLQQVIQSERTRRPLENIIDMTMDEAWIYTNGYQLEWLPPISNSNPYRSQQGSEIPVKFTVTDFEGNFVIDQTSTLQVLDSNGNVVVGPIPVSNNPNNGIKIQGSQYHYNLKTKDLPAGSYTLQVIYNSINGAQPETRSITLTKKK